VRAKRKMSNHLVCGHAILPLAHDDILTQDIISQAAGYR